MALVNILHMKVGDGESSYASNSVVQETGIQTGIQKVIPFLKRSIKGVINNDVFNDCFTVADLGCASGTNALLVSSNIIDVVHEVCQENNLKVPQFQVCLNDLFGNDFNTIFKLLPEYYANLKRNKGERFGPCFVSAVPGSFYDRIFPDQSVHFVHSGFSLNWLSQVPQGLENNGTNIYMSKTSPSNVYEEYGKQWHTDFTKFLQMRSEEIVHGGSMVLTFPARSIVDPTSEDGSALMELLGQSLVDMLKEGLVQESDINSFNIPAYIPWFKGFGLDRVNQMFDPRSSRDRID
ncbi:hypothetical protein L1987_79081 [Smallanthus sonchifolius]|uniref:Uncharacterized protein n=1 Tax=Smallanthus sonchifolius TaxID=185202 RepID=A0ACB8ZEP9_9ASTR|nr:hypothetical protein L1987_79081 [Smallanthus sonchifolius]